MCPKDAEGIANSVDPDQTALIWSALFAQTFLSENLGSLQYNNLFMYLMFWNQIWFRLENLS